ncbi:hypothetical protein BD311DRAFT_781609 [Dichomitus squalens]|uniref:DUF6535 domain-containing protein n=1 Tax=Dichomitus squalens TaxID=114155 RepID=A0A4Q9M926_9APHY|nr:hypothetical protein BD311DRAFT_781609 [Dichomitus squalens]
MEGDRNMPQSQELWEKRKLPFDAKETQEAWENAAESLQTYSEEMVQRWNAELDNMLLYAALFSAILTAFNVQSYSLLQPAPPDPVLSALQRISTQLGSFSVTPTTINSTVPAFISKDSTPPSAADRTAVWLNTLWFSSLILSTTASSVAIMVKQWLREFQRGVSGTSRASARDRQHRLNNLLKWQVPAIVAALPILLQLSLNLFFAGLLTVATVATVLIGIHTIFAVGTTILSVLVPT